MFRTLRTIMTGAIARAEDRVKDTCAIELIEQKIREANVSPPTASNASRRRATKSCWRTMSAPTKTCPDL